MRVAVAATEAGKVAGHIGQSRRWLVFEGEPGAAPQLVQRVELTKDQVFHHWQDQGAHPLDGVAAVIGQSAGEGFLNRMRKRGVEPVMTAEDDPAAAVQAWLEHQVTPPRPRPIGSLICKAKDLFSKHK